MHPKFVREVLSVILESPNINRSIIGDQIIGVIRSINQVIDTMDYDQANAGYTCEDLDDISIETARRELCSKLLKGHNWVQDRIQEDIKRRFI
jgi:hypothetical protein